MSVVMIDGWRVDVTHMDHEEAGGEQVGPGWFLRLDEDGYEWRGPFETEDRAYAAAASRLP